VEELTPRTTHPWVAEARRKVSFGAMILSPRDLSPSTVDFARRLEELGFASLFIADHPLGNGDCWTTLAAFAVATRSVRLGTLVCCVYYRPPELLARHAADVDRLSRGRLTLGVGIGDAPDEFERMGRRYPSVPERQRALDDTVRVVRGLWGERPFSYEGELAALRDANVRPGPVQEPRVPILVAGGGERTTLRFAAQYADACNLGAAAWAGHAYTPEDARRKLWVLGQHCAELGRPANAVLRTALLSPFLSESAATAQAKLAVIPPQRLGFWEQIVVAGTPEDAIERVRALLEVGFQYVIFFVPSSDRESLELLVRRVLPVVAGPITPVAGDALGAQPVPPTHQWSMPRLDRPS
jgi:alkanesulfonate monooxygenase SsuD/methylene tetrahydromethanopterin reductase-like flavin-dependent oxidoreductase (luciferase family)